MSNILDRIVDNKRREVEAKYANRVYDSYSAPQLCNKKISFSRSLLDSDTGIIAEFKRRSPSKGEIHPMAIASEVVKGYAANGAAC